MILFCLLCNAHYESLTFILPGREEIRWELILDTNHERGFVKTSESNSRRRRGGIGRQESLSVETW